MAVNRREMLVGGLFTAAGAAALPLTRTQPAEAAAKPPAPVGLSRFGFMFPNLGPFTGPTNQDLADLAQTQFDPARRGPAGNTTIPSGYVYFGQFIDHDLTLDTAPSPTAPVDPRRLTNGRTFRFDLDSLYGGGPDVSPQLYDTDRSHFLVQNPSGHGVRDLPRNMGGGAVLVEGRNDENQIISQLHLALLMFHNKLADTMGFAAAQRQTILHYQWTVLHDFLPKIVGQNVVNRTLNRRLTRFYQPTDTARPFTPVEWSVAAYRFGHSMVRFDYKLNDETEGGAEFTDLVTVFDADGHDDLHGGRDLPANRQALWGYFFNELTDTDDIPARNFARRIDTLMSEPLFLLPIPGAEASGSNVLGYRNLVRGKFYGLPSGQDVARAMGITPVQPKQLDLGAAFRKGTPLWYYILAEAEAATGDQVLGAVGGRIVADVFVKLLEIDPGSILNTSRFKPAPPVAKAPGDLTVSDLLLFAGVAPPPVR